MSNTTPIEPQPKPEDLDFKKLIWLQINRVNITAPRSEDFFHQVENLLSMTKIYFKITTKKTIDKLIEEKDIKLRYAHNEFKQNKVLYEFYRKVYDEIILRLDEKGWLLGAQER